MHLITITTKRLEYTVQMMGFILYSNLSDGVYVYVLCFIASEKGIHGCGNCIINDNKHRAENSFELLLFTGKILFFNILFNIYTIYNTILLLYILHTYVLSSTVYIYINWTITCWLSHQLFKYVICRFIHVIEQTNVQHYICI